jgi:retinol dehydrogenase-13
VIGVNHIAHAYLTQLLMPTLVASAPSRVVVVSSKAHIGPPLDYQALDRMSKPTTNARNGWGTLSSYQQSKLANILFARALASRYKDRRVTAYSLHPGVIKTNLGSKIPLSNFLMMFFTIFVKEKTIAEGAATTIYCTLKPGLESETGRYFDDSTVTDLADKWTDDDINRFWEWTEKVIQEHTATL